MSEGTEIAVREQGQMELTPQDIVRQVNLIHQVMKTIMKEGEHYGIIPGCGDKPTLLQPGAEKICMTFRLAPKYQIETLDLGGGHREYRVTCSLHHIVTGNFVGCGVGTAATMETKWRFRSGPVEFTGNPVPKEYWDMRETEPAKAVELIGGKGFGVRKNPDGGSWEIVRKGERQEHDNPADFYNTAMKIAAKRAFCSATKGATAASDVFTVDVEEMAENGIAPEPQEGKRKIPAESCRLSAVGHQQAGPTVNTFHVQTVLGEVNSKTGTGSKGEWTRWYAKGDDEEFYSTFKSEVADQMVLCQGELADIIYRLEKTPKGESRTVVSIGMVQQKVQQRATGPGASDEAQGGVREDEERF